MTRLNSHHLRLRLVKILANMFKEGTLWFIIVQCSFSINDFIDQDNENCFLFSFLGTSKVCKLIIDCVLQKRSEHTVC